MSVWVSPAAQTARLTSAGPVPISAALAGGGVPPLLSRAQLQESQFRSASSCGSSPMPQVFGVILVVACHASVVSPSGEVARSLVNRLTPLRSPMPHASGSCGGIV